MPGIKNICRIKIVLFRVENLNMNIVYFGAEKYYRLAFDYFHYENNPKLAYKYINQALKDNKNHFKSLMLKGEILLGKRNFEGALKNFKKACKINPENPAGFFFEAKTYNLLDEYKKALEIIDKILNGKIRNAEFLSECYRLKIDILMNLNQYKKAEKILKNLNNKLTSSDIYDLEENFYKTVENKKYFENNTENRILHINF